MLMRKLSRPSAIGLFVVLLVSVLLVGVADYLTGSELAFSVFYFVPIGLAAWYINRNAGLLLSGLSAFTWYLADILARAEPYAHAFIPVWNTSARLITFLTITALLAILQETLECESLHARIDPLTGAANDRAFYEAAETEISRLRRYGRPFSVLHLDVDNLKRINDAEGHMAGDRVLKALVASLKRTLRAGDTIARLGGDEFAVLLAEADGHAAEVVTSRVRSAIRLDAALAAPVTCSVGILTCPSAPNSVDEMIERVDGLMYEAKRAGRDPVRLAVFDGAT
jgi:diguanylate cyclase (GGDEF)-like protein